MTTTTAARPATADDAVAGVGPSVVALPATADDVASVLRSAAEQGHVVVPVGGRTKTGWAAPPASCDVLLDLTGLDRVVEHTAGDLVVVAEAGVRLETLQAQLAEAGQMLALDPPERGATLGGIVSANASGPRRLRYGTVRDLLIGVTVVLADGSTASSGGKVVKNVAGLRPRQALHRRARQPRRGRVHHLAPAPAAAGARRGRRPGVGQRGGGPARRPGQPLDAHADRDRAGVGLGTGAARRAVRVDPRVGGRAVRGRRRPARRRQRAARQPPAWFGGRPGGPDDLVLRLAYEPFALPAVLDALGDAHVTASTGTGVAYAAYPAAAGVAALPGLRAALAPYDGSAVVLHAPAAVRAGLDHWGPVGDAFPLMQRVKERFDPERRLSPGRLLGGL